MIPVSGFSFWKNCLVLLTAGTFATIQADAASVRMEAEQGTLVPGDKGHMPSVVERPDASGGKVIEYFTDGSGIEFLHVGESNKIILDYATCSNGSECFIDIYVNGKLSAPMAYKSTGNWTAPYRKLEIPVYIPEGATVRIVSRRQSINVDAVEFGKEAMLDSIPENMVSLAASKLENGAEVVRDIMSNGGRVACLGTGGASVVFSIAPKEIGQGNTAVIRYGSETESRVSVSVNGGPPVVKTLAATGTRKYGEFIVSGLKPDSANSIQIVRLGDSGVLLDTVTFCHLEPASGPVSLADIPVAGDRKTISLNGIWECTTTSDTASELPYEYDNRIQVPGLWDIAGRDLGSYDGKSLWYRTTVRTGKIPERVTLRINKAQFGTYVYVNGKPVGEYTYIFTPSQFDIAPFLKQDEDNEIVIRLQNKKYQQDNPKSLGHLGFDGERKYYWPGIYDDVSLIVSGNPVVSYLQTAPDIDQGTVYARAFLKNDSASSRTTPVTFRVYRLGIMADGVEPAIPELVAEYQVKDVSVPAGKETVVSVPAMALKGYDKGRDVWSPDNPALYKLVVSTSGDTFGQRFGMRTFRFDETTKMPILNGKPHYLRGTNIAFNRFCDDPARKDLPWKDGWARELFREFKKVNFECFRTHTAFLPEKWYEVADETGLMIMDEYPYWQHCDGEHCTAETVTPEVRAWMMDRGMHPSVIVWDVQNESFQPWLIDVLNTCRGIDLQKRPGDCGWGHNTCKTDMKESHPYFYSEPDFTLGYMNCISPVPWTFGNKSEDLPLVINEYGWNWLNREGDPTELGKRSYDFIMPGSSREERLAYQADSLAELTEFWRVGGKCVGILQFCGLSYSLPNQDGATSDILQPDIAKPRIRPYLAQRLRDAFSPVCLVIGDYTEEVLRGKAMTIPVTVINDSSESVDKLDVRVRLFQGDKVFFDTVRNYSVAPASRETQEFSVLVPGKETAPGEVLKLVAEYVRQGETVQSIRNWKVLDRVAGLAFRKPATASSFHHGTYYRMFQAPNVNDGASNTRWQSGKDDKAPWVMIDLGEKQDLARVLFDWSEVLGKKYYPEQYAIQVSDDGTGFRTIYEGKASDSGPQIIDVDGSGRYVRMLVTGKMPAGVCALWEMDVWAK